MAKGFITVELMKSDSKGTVTFNIRPEIVSMYRADGDYTLVWFDPMDAPFISVMSLEEFETVLQMHSLEY